MNEINAQSETKAHCLPPSPPIEFSIRNLNESVGSLFSHVRSTMANMINQRTTCEPGVSNFGMDQRWPDGSIKDATDSSSGSGSSGTGATGNGNNGNGNSGNNGNHYGWYKHH